MFEPRRQAQRVVDGEITRSQFIRQGLAAGLAVGVLASALTACGGTAESDSRTGTGKAPVAGTPPETPTGTAIVADAQIPRATNWDAASSLGGYDERVFSLMYEPLIDITSDGRLVPLLAESYRRLDDRTLRIVLRAGVRFHDGSPLTVRDVQATLGRLGAADSTVPFASLFTPFTVRASGPRTLDIVTEKPFGPLEGNLVQARIMSARALADAKLLRDRPNGTGPFRFVSRDAQKTVMEANPGYWGERGPYIRTIEYRTITDQSARVDALRTGSAHVLVEASPAQAAVFAPDSAFFVPPQRMYTGGQFVYILRQSGPLRDVRVRQAVAYAVDREAISKSILRGVDPVAYSPLPTVDPFYRPLEPRFSYDPERAKSLLRAAGVNGATLSMATSSLFQFAPEADQAVARYLEAVGISVRLDRVDVGAYAAGVYTRYDISLNALVEFSPNDPDFLFSFYRPPLAAVIFGREDPRMSSLATRQRYVTGRERQAAVDAAAQYIWEQQPLLYLADNYFPDVVSARVSNYNPTPAFGITGLKDAWLS